MSSNQYTVNIVNADELYIGGRKIQALELGVLVSDDASYGIGIGTDKPRLKLDISGADGIRIPVGTTNKRPTNATITGSGATNLLGILRYNTTTEKYEAVCDSESLSVNPSWCNFVIETGTNVGNNKVGINTGTVTPSQTLDVNGQIGINDYIIHNDDTNTKIGFPTNYTLTITTGGTERMRVSPDGNVGIGTTNPKGNLHVFNSTLNSPSDFLSTSINRLTNEPSSTTDIYYNYLENTLVKELNNSSGYWSSVPRYGFKLGSWRNSNSSGLILKTINSAAIDWKTRLKINHNGFFYFNSPDSNLEKFYSPYHFSFKPTGDGKYGNLIPSTNSKINDLTFSNFSTAQTDTKNIFGEYPVFIGKGCSLYSVPSPTLANTKFIAFSKEGSSGQQNFYGGGIMLNDKIHFITYNKTQTTSGLNDSAGNTITDGAELQLSTYTRMTIDQSGNVGIGTTSPKCTLNTNNIMTDSDNTIPVDGGDLNDTTSLFLGKSSSIENNYWGLIMGSTWAAGKGYIQTYNKTQANYKADLLLNPTNGGNVGIGTDSPDYKLEVNGTIGMTGYIYHSGDPNTYFGFPTTDAFAVTTSGTERMKIDSAGNVGMGIAPSSSYKLYVAGTVKATSFNTSHITITDYRINQPTGRLELQSGNNRDVVLCANSTGKVGIGVIDPDEKLEVAGNIKVSSQIWLGSYIKHLPTSENTYMGFPQANEIFFGTNSAERMRIDSAGNVGIGTNAPKSTLDVVGQILIQKSSAPAKTDSGQDFDDYYLLIGDDESASNASRLIGFGYMVRGHSPMRGPDCYFGSKTNNSAGGEYSDIIFGTSSNSTTVATEKMRIRYDGNVGIGTSTPGYPLHVRGGNNWTQSGGGYYFSDHLNQTTWRYDGGSSYSLTGDFQNYLWAGGFVVSSDERIKKNIRDLSDNESLIKLRDISCVHYEYKDEVSKGKRPTIGFIAQQVATVYPEAVSKYPNIIPNEYRNLTDISWDEVTRTDSTGNTETIYYLTSESMGDVSGCKYRFECGDISANIEEIEMELKGDEYNRFEFKYKYPEIFLYGKEVDDFHTLDKQKLFALAFSATQEIDKIQQAEKTKLEEQTSKLAATESKLEAAEAKIATLENTLADVLTRLAALE